MAIDYDALLKEARIRTDTIHQVEISRLTRLSEDDLEQVMMQSGIDKKQLTEILLEIKATSKSNADKAQAISNIHGGVQALVQIVSKLI